MAEEELTELVVDNDSGKAGFRRDDATKHNLTTSHAGPFPSGVVSFMSPSASFEKSKFL